MIKRISFIFCLIILISCGKENKQSQSTTVKKQSVEIASDTDYARGFIREATIRVENKDYGEAYRYIYIMMKNYPSSQHIDEGKKLLDKIFRLSDRKDVFKISSFLNDEEDFETAINVLERIYSKAQKPTVQADALYYKGLNYEHINRIDDMKNTWLKLTKEFPQSVWAAEVLYGIAFTIYQQTNDPSKARPYLKELYKRFPRSKWVLEGKELEKSWVDLK